MTLIYFSSPRHKLGAFGARLHQTNDALALLSHLVETIVTWAFKQSLLHVITPARTGESLSVDAWTNPISCTLQAAAIQVKRTAATDTTSHPVKPQHSRQSIDCTIRHHPWTSGRRCRCHTLRDRSGGSAWSSRSRSGSLSRSVSLSQCTRLSEK